MGERIDIPGGLRDQSGQSADPTNPADTELPANVPPLLPQRERELIRQMQDTGIIQPEPATTPAIDPHAGRSGVVFTLNDEHDQVVCGLIPPRTYVLISPLRFQFDAFKVIVDLLKSPEGQHFVQAQGWEVFIA